MVKRSQKPEDSVVIIEMAVGQRANIGRMAGKAKINSGTLDAWRTLKLSINFGR